MWSEGVKLTLNSSMKRASNCLINSTCNVEWIVDFITAAMCYTVHGKRKNMSQTVNIERDSSRRVYIYEGIWISAPIVQWMAPLLYSRGLVYPAVLLALAFLAQVTICEWSDTEIPTVVANRSSHHHLKLSFLFTSSLSSFLYNRSLPFQSHIPSSQWTG